MVNVTIYGIHGSYGYVILLCFISVIGCIKLHQLSSNILIISQSSNFKVQLGKKTAGNIGTEKLFHSRVRSRGPKNDL